jgi:hypothetical protein
MAVENTLDEPFLNQLSLMLGSFMWFSIWRKEHGAMQWKKDSYQMGLMHGSGYIWLVG